MSYKIKELGVEARLIDQVAQVQVSQTFVNTGSRPMEVAFVFPLPYDGAIEQMTLLIDGSEYPAKLLDAKEARRMYEEIVRKNRDPALLEWLGTGLFRTNVFPVPAGASRTVTLRYSQLCRKQEGLTDFLFPVEHGEIHLRGRREGGDSRDDREPGGDQERLQPLAQRGDQAAGRASRHGHVQQQERGAQQRFPPALRRGQGEGEHAGVELPARAEPGRLLLAVGQSRRSSRPTEKRPEKTVLLVIDRSGSMSGKKIEQVRAALKYVLNNLRPGDLFNIVAYDSQVEAVPARIAAVRRGDAQGRLGLRRGSVRRRHHGHRRRDAHRLGSTARRRSGPAT